MKDISKMLELVLANTSCINLTNVNEDNTEVQETIEVESVEPTAL
ncbi:hypothetical protein TSMG0159 [Halocynthia phage JM-2012]|nr:hypothetical protein TSMG0159 [Halocynthia phage JM-2012]AFI55442.1 hypothetical protein TSMG0159 [Halocynthia phage JM-2012]